MAARRSSARATPIAAILIALAIGCGGPTEEERTLRVVPPMPEMPAGNAAAPEVLSVRLDPTWPEPGKPVRAIVQSATANGERARLSFQWKVLGQAFGSDAPSIVLPGLVKGDPVGVTVVAHQGERSSEPVTISTTIPNSPPVVRNLRLRTRGVGATGEQWLADVRADDPDRDPVEIRYQWLKNGEPHPATGQAFPTRDLKRGDTLSVRVFATDGEDQSSVAASGHIAISNSAPDILSNPPPVAEGSNAYRYQVEAKDPDGDPRLSFSLVEAPGGMTLDGDSGLLTWRPHPAQTGRHRIEFAVEDGQGGRTVQQFELAIVLDEVYDTAPAAAPAP